MSYPFTTKNALFNGLVWQVARALSAGDSQASGGLGTALSSKKALEPIEVSRPRTGEGLLNRRSLSDDSDLFLFSCSLI